MIETTRRVAVLGGSRIPFARQNGPYAKASNQDMLTAALDAVVDRFGLDGETVGEVAAGAVLKHSRDFNLTRETVLGSRAGARDARPTTSSRPAGPAWRPRSSSPTRSRSARWSPGSPAASTPPPTPRWRSTRTCASCCSKPAGRSPTPPACACWPGCGPSSSSPRSRATPSRARACRWASTPRSWPRSGGSAARSRTSSPWPATTSSPPPTTPAGWMISWCPFLGQERDQNLRPDSSLEKLAKLKPVVRRARGHDDRGQLDAAVGRRPRPCCWPPRSGPTGAASPCRPSSSTRRPRPSITSTSARAC